MSAPGDLQTYQCPVCEERGPAGSACPRHDLYFSNPRDIARSKRPRLLGHLLSERFAILGLLGKGGMAHVYWGIDAHTGERVAIKVMRSNLTETLAAEQRFLRESAIMCQIDTPRLIRCFHSGVEDHAAYMVMELLEGVSLEFYLRHGQRDIRTLSAIAVQLLEGVAAIHANDLMHRDLKPANVMLCNVGDGQASVKIIDFGLARRLESEGPTLTGADDVLGTARYMSPDHIKGSRNVGPPADVYAVGVMLYELLCGHTPFEASNAFDMVRQHIQDPVPPLLGQVDADVPVGLIEFVHRCLAKAPEDRFATGNDALAAFWQLDLDDEGPIWFTKPDTGSPEPTEGADSLNVTIALSDDDLVFEEIPPERSIILTLPS